MSHITAASLTAFLYAGAVARDRELGPGDSLFELYQGRTGFVFYAERIAKSLVAFLQHPNRQADEYPGVLEYELIEPLGGWLIANADVLVGDHIDLPATATAYFSEQYIDWLNTPVAEKAAPEAEAQPEADKPADVERTIMTKNYEITLDLHGDHRGYFEHNGLGDERAGGLWYDENKNLTDYDGVVELPREVREALIADGFTSTEGCLDA
jgi:hypothetical protein